MSDHWYPLMSDPHKTLVYWNPKEGLPNPELRLPDEFIDEAWLKRTFQEEGLLQGFRLSRSLFVRAMAEAPQAREAPLLSETARWWCRLQEAQRSGRATGLLCKGEFPMAGGYPLAGIFRRTHELLLQRRAPATWPLAVLALLGGVCSGLSRHFEHFVEGRRPPYVLADDPYLSHSWRSTYRTSLEYLGASTPASAIDAWNHGSRGRIRYARINRRDPGLYRNMVKSIHGSDPILVSRGDDRLFLLGYRVRPTALIFYRMSTGSSHQVRLLDWIATADPDETVSITDRVEQLEPELSYELPTLAI